MSKGFVGGALSILALAAWTALLGEVARFHEGGANFAGGQTHIRGMTGPGQVGAVKVAAVARIAMEVGGCPQRRQLRSALPCLCRGARPAYVIAGQRRFDLGNECRRLTIDLPVGLE